MRWIAAVIRCAVERIGRWRWHWITLGLVIAAGALLRFWRIEHPPLWGDEGYVFMRVRSGYRDLLDYLRFDLFGPLHYEMYWVMGRRVWLTPAILRIPPAVAGTLMIPVMYWLGRQLLSRPAALLVAAYAAFGAYLLNYSRDAKMYMSLWLMCAANMACLIAWLRARPAPGRMHWQTTAWLGWIATGAFAAGLHLTYAIVLGIQPLIVLSHRPRWRTLAAFLLGAVIILAGAAGYFLAFNEVADKVERHGAEKILNAAGIGWVEQRNRDRSAADLIRDSAGAFGFNLEYPTATERRQVPPWIMTASLWAMTAMGVIAAYGAGGRWRKRGQGDDGTQGQRDDGTEGQRDGGTEGQGGRSARGDMGTSRILPGDTLPVTNAALREYSECPLPRDRGRSGEETERTDGRASGWRTALWLGAWIVLPTYGFYLLSTNAAAQSPSDWLRAGWGALKMARWPWIAPIASAPWAFPAAGQVKVAILVALLIALILAVAMLCRIHRWAAIGLALAGAAIPPLALGLAWKSIGGHDASALISAGWAQLTRPALLGVGVILVTGTAFHSCACSLRGRVIRSAMGLAVAAILLGLCALMHRTLQPMPGSIWMPRYLGVIAPAVMLAMSGLIMRLPGRAARAIAIAVLLGINLTNALGRIYADSEPPMDRVARDVVEAGRSGGSPRVIFNSDRGGAHPAEGWVNSTQGKFYLANYSRVDFTPFEFRGGQIMDQFRGWYSTPSSPRAVKRVARDPAVRRILVWERFLTADYGRQPQPPAMPYAALDDPILGELGPDWRLESTQVWRIRQHWAWRELGWAWRRVYERSAAAAPAVPAAAVP